MVQAVSNPCSKVKRNGKTETVYVENYYSDEILQYTIRRAYTMFRVIAFSFFSFISDIHAF